MSIKPFGREARSLAKQGFVPLTSIAKYMAEWVEGGMTQGSAVTDSCDLETLVWGQGPGVRRGNSRKWASSPAQESSDLALKSF